MMMKDDYEWLRIIKLIEVRASSWITDNEVYMHDMYNIVY